ncbi:hypothetical protein OGATHE_001762, partial [Ogataea polymorpha]
KHRFRLVRAFSEQVKHDKTIYSALMNILDFFQPFLTIVEQAVSNEKKTLEKQVKEVILLASWKDVNIDALKQSSRKSHQSLYKLVRKYRDLLNSTITEMVESGLGSTPVVINQKTIGMVPVSLGELGSSEVS